jgi:hypothetical protein
MIGIYSLYWPEPDLVYVGQSVNIEKRIEAHNYRARCGQDSAALNATYSTYGTPEVYVLEACSVADLDTKEILWITEFDRVLNVSKGGSSGNYGQYSGKCVYTEQELIGVLFALQKPIPIREIEKTTGVSFDVVQSIAYQKRHGWLSEVYPVLWDNLPNVKRFSLAQVSRYKTNVTLISPEGLEYVVTNLSEFSKTHALNKGHICAVARGAEPQHKGWKRKEASDG